MATFQQYWNGDVQASISQENVPDRLLKKDRFYHRGWSISRWNLAFQLYYEGIASVKAFKAAMAPPASSKRITSITRESNRLAKLMKTDLHNAATTGWGWGVSDLREGFEHLVSNNGGWTDTNYGTYSGSLGRIHGLGPSCTTAACAANFLTAYENRLKEIGEKMKQMKSGLSKTSRLVQRLRNSNRVGTTEWQAFGRGLSEVNSGSGYIEKSLWVLRLSSDPDGTASNVLNLGENVATVIGKWLSAISLVRDTVDIYNKALSSGMTPEQGAALVAANAVIEGAGQAATFVEAAGTVVGGMGVLLGVYAAALKAIPDIYKQFTDIAQRQRDYMNLALNGPQAGQRMPGF